MTTAAELLRVARAHLGEPYLLGVIAPKANPRWRGPWDCAEFASWCVYQACGTLYGCRPRNGDPDRVDAWSGFWAADARRSGSVIPVAQAAATPGAVLVRKPGAAIGHVAISAGAGRTVEAHSRQRGVIEARSTGRRWDLGVLVPGLAVELASVPAPLASPGTVLRIRSPRMQGPQVRVLQQALADAGFDPGPVDGVFGHQTGAAVRAYQAAQGLVVDGEAGRETAQALRIRLD